MGRRLCRNITARTRHVFLSRAGLETNPPLVNEGLAMFLANEYYGVRTRMSQ
jgi:hypothetical protein